MPKYGCLMLPLPYPENRIVKGWSACYLDPADLYGDGVEDFLHITLKYGFVESPGLVGRLRQTLAELTPPVADVYGLSMFPDGGDGEVLKLSVKGVSLHRIHKILSEEFRCEDKHPQYKPHVTIAYLKPGEAKKYTRMAPPPRLVIPFPTAVYSDAQGRKVALDFGPVPRPRQGVKTLSAMDVNTGGALVAPPTFGQPIPRYRARRSVVAPVVRKWAKLMNWRPPQGA